MRLLVLLGTRCVPTRMLWILLRPAHSELADRAGYQNGITSANRHVAGCPPFGRHGVSAIRTVVTRMAQAHTCENVVRNTNSKRGFAMAEIVLRLIVAMETGWSTLSDRTAHRREQGATAVEYGLMVALIAIVIIAAVTLLGSNLSSLFSNVGNSVHS
jgi:pilus assembly protein Flp/PilA